MQQIIQYPTEWTLGKPRGSIKDYYKKGHMVVISPPNAKQYDKKFLFMDYGNNKAKTLLEAENWRYSESAKLGLTRNQIRYLDKDTIEVQLTQDKVMKTDARFLNQIDLYPLQAKFKKTKIGDRFYVVYQDKKLTGQFTDLIASYNIVEYINGDSLDLRSINLREFGAIKINIDKVDEAGAENQISYFRFFDTKKYDKLPRNIWILGKPTGTIFQRKGEDVINVRIVEYVDNIRDDIDDNSESEDDIENVNKFNIKKSITHSKTFKISDYDSEKDANNAAKKWQIETSYKLGTTRNLVRINGDIIEIKISKNNITKTDLKNIELVQSIPIHSFNQKKVTSKCYARCVVKGVSTGLHNLVSGFLNVHHIDNDTLNNCLSNLQDEKEKESSGMRTDTKPSLYMMGVVYVNDRNGGAFRAHIKENDVTETRSFSIIQYGVEKAEQMAILYRYYLMIKHKSESGNYNPDWVNCKDINSLSSINDIKKEIGKCQEIYDKIIINTMYDTKLLTNDEFISDNIKISDVYEKYLLNQIKRTKDCKTRLTKLKDILHQKENDIAKNVFF
jgi:hypothetical protein